MIGWRSSLAAGLLALAAYSPRTASAQVGLPPPPGAYGAYNGYAPPPQTQYANPVALGLGISLIVVGAGMLVGGFVMLAGKETNHAVGGALVGLGGTMFASSIPLIIMGAQQVPVAPGYQQMKLHPVVASLGAPRILLPDAATARPGGVAWAWSF